MNSASASDGSFSHVSQRRRGGQRTGSVLVPASILVLSVPQLYVFSIAGISLSAFMCLAAMMAIAMMAKSPIQDLPYIGLILILLVKLFYTMTGSIVDGIRDIWVTLPFIGFFLLGLRHSDPSGTWRLLKPVVIFGCIQSAMVIVFRLDPSLEAAFWRSRVAEVAIGPNTILPFLSGQTNNNTLAADKAGGIFLNANVAGSWSVAMFFISASLFPRFKSRPLAIAVCVVHFLGAAMCGSKASAIALVILPLLIGGLISFKKLHLLRSVTLSVSGIMVVFAIFFAVIMLAAFPPKFSEFGDASESTFAGRQMIWDVASRYFAQHPLYGLGYGGWYAHRLRDIGGTAALQMPSLLYPPHNAFVYLWTYNGLAGVILAFFFFAVIIKRSLQKSALSALEQGGLLCAVGGVLFQAQGENFPMFGEYHTAPLVGLCCGLLMRGWLLANVSEDAVHGSPTGTPRRAIRSGRALVGLGTRRTL